jgi:hypothetical protein
MGWFEKLHSLYLQKMTGADLKSCVPFIYKDHWFEELCPLHLQRSHELIWRVVPPSFTKITDFKSCVPFISKNNFLKNCVPLIYNVHWFEELCPFHLQRSHELIWRVVSPSFTKINDFKSCVPFISKNNLLKNCVPFIYKDHIVCLQIHVSHKSDFIWRIITPLFTKIENVKVSTI